MSPQKRKEKKKEPKKKLRRLLRIVGAEAWFSSCTVCRMALEMLPQAPKEMVEGRIGDEVRPWQWVDVIESEDKRRNWMGRSDGFWGWGETENKTRKTVLANGK